MRPFFKLMLKCELPMRLFFKLMLKSGLLVQNGHLVTQIGLEDRDGDFDVDVMSVGPVGACQLRRGSLPTHPPMWKSESRGCSESAPMYKSENRVLHFLGCSIRPYF